VPAGSVVLVTCHRVEAYAASRAGIEHLEAVIPAGGRLLVGGRGVHHLVSVAAGRDSVVAGEDEILHQLREALASARRTGPVDPIVGRALTIALRAGRQARSWLQGPRRSLGDVAVDAIRAEAGSVTGRPILIVGAGRMGAIAARCAARAGARVTIANRSQDRATVLATAIGADTTSLDPGTTIREAAGIVIALGGPWQIAPGTAEALVAGEAVVVDLSFPPAVPAGLSARLGRRLISADMLAAGSPQVALREAPSGEPVRPRHPSATLSRMDRLINGAVTEFEDWTGRSDARAAARALIRRADEHREVELAALWRRMPDLEPDARAAIEGMTRHLAGRLLQAPLERLQQDPDGRDGRAVREIFAL
jgi:glutamyl-tRNA reductase